MKLTHIFRKTIKWWLPWLIVGLIWIVSLIALDNSCIDLGGGPCQEPWLYVPEWLLLFALAWLVVGPALSFFLMVFQIYKLIQIMRNVG